MSRLARVTHLGQPHLVLARANGGTKLFYENEDFESYVDNLFDLARQEVIRLFSFCLHTDELRLLITPTAFPLSRIMQRLHGSHTLRINSRQNRRGPLFQGRFESQVVGDEQLLEAVRNIHLWPVRKGLVRRPENYAWSSHGAYINPESSWARFLSNEAIFDGFSDSSNVSKRAFARYVESAALEPEELLEQHQLAELKNIDKKKLRRLSLSGLAKRVSLLLNVNVLMLPNASRRQEFVMARRLFATVAVMNNSRSVTEVAEFLNRDKAQVSRLVSQGMDMAARNEPFKLLYNSI
ncbi:MAG: hypothetical protein V4534_00320 [Myxococcota bacterium]